MAAGRKKQKVKWSKLYTFSCLHPQTNEGDPSSFAGAPSAQSFIGQPGFSRVVFCNESHCHKLKPYNYPNNYVATTKYNAVTFFPIALFEQFRRVANLYFLLAAVLSVTSLAPFTPVSVISPLVFVVGISMLKEAMEDWNRFLQDLKVNARKVKAHIGNGEFMERAWKEVYVGDVIKVNKNEYFPSDLLLLSSSYEDGLCYVETMNLDGETNLKVKRSLEATLSLDSDERFNKFLATVRCEDPNPNLYTFVGNLEFENESHPLSPSQILLRDSKLRNTDYIYGVVVFSGPDTKAVRNSTRSPSKRSRVERKMDHVIYVLFTILILISIISSIGSTIFTNSEAVKWYYLELKRASDSSFDPSKPVVSCSLQFIRALVLYGYLIPISLYVSIEVVKVLQAMLINKDQKMYDEVTDKAVEARTSNLNEELGQVEMILTDKTGTLTCNQMEFRKCSIEGISYGGEVTEIDLAASRRMDIEVERYRFSLGGYESNTRSLEMFEFSMADPAAEKMVLGLDQGMEKPNTITSRNSVQERDSVIKGFNFKDDRLMDKMWINRSNVSDMMMFFRVMALCHTGIPVEDEKSDRLKYEAESPEEVAFLIAAQEFGFKFCHRTQSVMAVQELDPSSGMDVKREYKLLNLLEFNSSRKRMSVIVRNQNGDIFLLCKGADNVIFDRLTDNGRTYQQATSMHLSNYAEDGLRTLLFAYKKIKSDEYEKWNSVFTKAKATIGPEREELLENASEMIEKDMLLLGAVAIEDKLQKGVPECIDKLAQAGLKIWLLTGDKKETAVNIGFACSLLRHDMNQVHLTLSKEAESKNIVKVMREDILCQIERYYQMVMQEDRKDQPFALIVDGKALEIALSDDIKDQFLKLAVRCDSAICCRVSPKQKALITRLVKQHTGKTTLAIGDGANDVGMIQEADIGIGISGMEGMQAVMASDFSMPQFRFLERLLIVHGHWCYKRISKLILYFVYKNIAFGLTLFFYDILTTSSGQVLFDDWYIVIFNVFLTSLPVISLGVLEQDVSSEVCLKFPTLYQQGPKNICFSWKRIIGWILNASLTSLAILAINIYALSPAAFTERGEVADIGHIGAIIYTCIIWTVNCQIALIINHFTWISHLLIWGSIICWYIFLFLYGVLPPQHSKTGFHLLTEAIGPAAVYWIVTLLAVVTSLLPYFIHIIIQRSFFPMDDHLIQEMEHFRMDIIDGPMWLKEQQKSKEKTKVGFSARVDAKIRQLKEQLHRKKNINL
ncbi:probable phospholipid-transporting ATPase 5 [Nicotiana sylvestris]|uniref:Phospholipid-transporting ATPase n=1 Tax=Nicotiana sylvestris TaxID=4096 RepID=A0A1U7X969_NICSY|nr:PREDICTED: putative phospholipid-transporting ATPase 5 [Nicotiana sylvestris]XP_016468416.1 PREDICTED: probable phospholipid-transporting ATPase 5 [Nicotiana tabacum]